MTNYPQSTVDDLLEQARRNASGMAENAATAQRLVCADGTDPREGMGAIFWGMWSLAFVAGILIMLGSAVGFKADPHALLLVAFAAGGVLVLGCLAAFIHMGSRGAR